MAGSGVSPGYRAGGHFTSKSILAELCMVPACRPTVTVLSPDARRTSDARYETPAKAPGTLDMSVGGSETDHDCNFTVVGLLRPLD